MIKEVVRCVLIASAMLIPPSDTASPVYPSLPDTLPAAVAAQIDTAVAVELKLHPNVAYASGVKIADDEILSVGHLLRDENGTEYKVDTCNDLEIMGAHIPHVGSIGSYINRHVSSRSKDDRIPDISLLQSAYLPEYPNAQISTHKPRRGDRVYFINYEPDQEDNWRRPVLGHVKNERYVYPAIYGGVVVSKIGKDNLAVVTEKSYGVVPDTFTRGGSSGGPVFNEQGELIGLPAWIYKGKENLGKKVIEDRLNTDIPGDPPESPLGFTAVEPVTPKLIADLRTNLKSAPSC